MYQLVVIYHIIIIQALPNRYVSIFQSTNVRTKKTILVEMRSRVMHREINGGSSLAVESIHGLVLGFHEPLNLFADVVPRRK